MENTIKWEMDNRRIWIDGREITPGRSQQIYNHSPDGFNVGYGGSGPAQLALAIMLEFTDKDTALRLYQDFKFNVIAGLPQGKDFELKIDIKKWIEDREE